MTGYFDNPTHSCCPIDITLLSLIVKLMPIEPAALIGTSRLNVAPDVSGKFIRTVIAERIDSCLHNVVCLFGSHRNEVLYVVGFVAVIDHSDQRFQFDRVPESCGVRSIPVVLDVRIVVRDMSGFLLELRVVQADDGFYL